MDMKTPGGPTNPFPRPRSLGAILVDAGRLSPAETGRVLELQKENGLRFGEAALQLGVLNEHDVLFALAQQFEYACLLPGDPAISPDVLAAFGSRHPLVDQLRNLRSQVMLHWLSNKGVRKSLALVSICRGEGKSLIAANLAVLFSQLGQRTLLIDADLINPSQHTLFRLDNRSGLSSALSGLAELEAAAPIPHLGGLAVMPAGPTPPNPRELLARPLLADLFRQASQVFDVVLIDTPALTVAADAQLIAAHAGASVLISRPSIATVAETAALTDPLGNLLGVVVNRF